MHDIFQKLLLILQNEKIISPVVTEVVLMEVVLEGNGTDLVVRIISVVEDSSLTIENVSFVVGNGVALLVGGDEEGICEDVPGNIMVFVVCDGLTIFVAFAVYDGITAFVAFAVYDGITAFVALIVADINDEETTEDAA